MKAYCIDTSGLTTPLEHMPEDIHRSLWRAVTDRIEAGIFAVSSEVYDELTHIQGQVGECLRANRIALRLEVGDGVWDYPLYISHSVRMQEDHAGVISEYNGGRKSTVCLNDLSNVALGKTLILPVISSEKPLNPPSPWMKIPNLCAAEGVEHLTFNDFLRREGIIL